MAATPRKPALPIDDLLPEITAALRAGNNLVLQAEPGAGKTTRVPPALLEVVPGEVIVLEPRRLPARMAARRVAWERNEQAGETVGFQVRFEEAIGPKTRLRFVTEGILVRRLISDPLLPGVDAVVLDEFHERHIDSDLALALLRRLQQTTRPDLKIIVMSATLDAAPVAAFLGNCEMLYAAGRVFPLTVEYTPYSVEPLHVQVRQAVERLHRERHAGHTLVFLPGAAEIRRTMRECDGIARSAGLLMLPLYGDLSPAEQDRAVGPSTQPKLILSTNVAESSVTVEGVTAVIDSGLARVAAHSPWTGLPTLEIRRISKASATQRGGRAGRTAPGRVLRLYAEADFAQRAEHDRPEILRTDLSQLALTLRALDLRMGDVAWLDAPEAIAVDHAEALLDRLGAVGAMARRLARFPLPPRLARMLVAAEDSGVGQEGATAAALLSVGASVERNDLLEAMDAQFAVPDHRVRQTESQLRRLVGKAQPRHTGDSDEPLLRAMLQGFPDRVARRRTGKEILLGTGITAEMTGAAPQYEFMVVLDAEDRSDKPLPLVRMAARFEPDWLIDLFPDRVREESTLVWNRSAQRVEATTSLRYEGLLLQEWRDAKPDAEAAAAMLAHEAVVAGIARFVDEAAMENLQARAAFAGLDAPDVEAELRQLCLGLTRFSMDELRKAAVGLLPSMEARLDAHRLRDLAPGTLKLKAGRALKVHYETGKPPWIESRMQDFFGMTDGPRIGPEQTPVVMHLLGPNNRAVQTTADLAGFWQRLYPEVRRGLMRRYPKQKWPENPLRPNAQPKLA
ncbi:ATP-dependent helicase HrpB [Terriglobus roseus]|uniref:ATP-dependent helicase HrpB n=1 Tax=Terriglobus roseus TaxID=392734 RepID=A0A1H4MPH9_9BACT|nr:ATP-dependent helicase HrpB [Terriglobus roseus]SEB84899.1 ATP-dependent helicase HrpB [Terriglobus roseus]